MEPVLKKILKSRVVTYLIFGIIVLYMFLIVRLCRKQIVYHGNAKEIMSGHHPVIVACWHSRFMPMVGITYFGSFKAVTSSHKDGNYMEMILKYYGHSAIRGSSRKQATSAMRDILRIKREDMRLVITPDGPLGPRYKVKGGLVKVADRYKVPILPMSYSATHAKVLGTWDRFIVPIPFLSKLLIEFGTPVGGGQVSDMELESILVKQMKSLDKKCKLKVGY